MMLTTLTLQNFRSYTKKTFSFSPGVTVVVGPNGSGKTNILEAIMMTAVGKSFRADSDKETIAWGKELSAISGQQGETKLDIKITGGEVQGQKVPVKKYLVNGVPRRQIDFVGNLRAVLFWPEHLELVTDSPSLRRKYLDSVLVQTDREYRRNLLSYERGLRQRNRLLDLINEGKAGRSQLLFWDQLLIKAGGYLTDKRAEYIDYVNSYQLSAISCQLQYDKSVISESRLAQYADEEVAAKATLVGPHRDDFEIVICDKQKAICNTKDNFGSSLSLLTSHVSLSKYGSRGEQRLAVLWMKLAELEFITERSREAGSGSARPILLLDDIFSELDKEHRELVVGLTANQQTIITSADEDILEVLTGATVIRL